jgi:S1-C subfamily serine protease
MARSILLGLLLIASSTSPRLWAGDSLGPYVGLRVRDEAKSPRSASLLSQGGYQERRGSGVVVGTSPSGGWLVLTNNHVVAPESKQKVPVPSVYLDGDWRWGRVLRTDREADLALVLVNSPAKLRTISVADAVPADGSKVATRAFAAGTKWTKRAATIRHTIVLQDGKEAIAPHTHFVNVTFKPGESGGAVVANGRLVGLIYGNDIGNGAGLCVDLASIKAFLAGTSQRTAPTVATERPYLGLRRSAADFKPRPLGR